MVKLLGLGTTRKVGIEVFQVEFSTKQHQNCVSHMPWNFLVLLLLIVLKLWTLKLTDWTGLNKTTHFNKIITQLDVSAVEPLMCLFRNRHKIENFSLSLDMVRRRTAITSNKLSNRSSFQINLPLDNCGYYLVGGEEIIPNCSSWLVQVSNF